MPASYYIIRDVSMYPDPNVTQNHDRNSRRIGYNYRTSNPALKPTA